MTIPYRALRWLEERHDLIVRLNLSKAADRLALEEFSDEYYRFASEIWIWIGTAMKQVTYGKLDEQSKRKVRITLAANLLGSKNPHNFVYCVKSNGEVWLILKKEPKIAKIVRKHIPTT